MISLFRRLTASGAQEDSPLWLIVLADMMTNLMLFFLVMFAMSIQGPQARAELARTFDARDLVVPPPPQPARTEVAEEKVAAELRSLFADTSVDETSIRVRLKEALLFGFADAGLTPSAAEPLDKLARILAEIPNTVIVEGHTDSVPVTGLAVKSNWELSVARAGSVIERLASDGVAPSRLVASGYGDQRPLADNATVEGRARNRRVEILILRGKGSAP